MARNKKIAKKMRNVVGQTPRGADFFPRDKVIQKIYRRLESGANIFMAAPRRVGKTSIMRAMEDAPREGYHFIYVITESIHDVEEYYHKLLTAVLSSEAMSTLAKKREGLKNQLQDLLRDMNISIKLPWVEVDLNKDQEKKTYQASFEQLLAKLDIGNDTIVIMIDEFPQTVENIREKHGSAVAEMFLRLNREQRQTTHSKIRFILTGSIGLPAVVKKLTSDSVINDLNVVEIPALDEQEAQQLAISLLRSYSIQFDPDIIPYLLQKLKWLIPFHVQLAAQELIDIFESTEQPLTRPDVDRAFKSVLNLRNDIYFNHYFIRLSTSFPQAEHHAFALALLNRAALQEHVSLETVKELAGRLTEQERESVLEALLYDGYLVQENGRGYRFHSALLQQWWIKKSNV